MLLLCGKSQVGKDTVQKELIKMGMKSIVSYAVEDLSDDKVIIVNPHGLEQLRKIKSLNPIAFYITVGEETIWNRLRERGDNAAEARRRLNADDIDFADISKNVDFSFSNDLGLEPEVLAQMIFDTYNKVIGGRNIA